MLIQAFKKRSKQKNGNLKGVFGALLYCFFGIKHVRQLGLLWNAGRYIAGENGALAG